LLPKKDYSVDTGAMIIGELVYYSY